MASPAAQTVAKAPSVENLVAIDDEIKAEGVGKIHDACEQWALLNSGKRYDSKTLHDGIRLLRNGVSIRGNNALSTVLTGKYDLRNAITLLESKRSVLHLEVDNPVRKDCTQEERFKALVEILARHDVRTYARKNILLKEPKVWIKSSNLRTNFRNKYQTDKEETMYAFYGPNTKVAAQAVWDSYSRVFDDKEKSACYWLDRMRQHGLQSDFEEKFQQLPCNTKGYNLYSWIRANDWEWQGRGNMQDLMEAYHGDEKAAAQAAAFYSEANNNVFYLNWVSNNKELLGCIKDAAGFKGDATDFQVTTPGTLLAMERIFNRLYAPRYGGESEKETWQHGYKPEYNLETAVGYELGFTSDQGSLAKQIILRCRKEAGVNNQPSVGTVQPAVAASNAGQTTSSSSATAVDYNKTKIPVTNGVAKSPAMWTIKFAGSNIHLPRPDNNPDYRMVKSEDPNYEREFAENARLSEHVIPLKWSCPGQPDQKEDAFIVVDNDNAVSDMWVQRGKFWVAGLTTDNRGNRLATKWKKNSAGKWVDAKSTSP